MSDKELKDFAFQLWDDIIFQRQVGMNRTAAWRILVDLKQCDPMVAHRLWEEYQKKRRINQWLDDESEEGKHDY